MKLSRGGNQALQCTEQNRSLIFVTVYIKVTLCEHIEDNINHKKELQNLKNAVYWASRITALSNVINVYSRNKAKSSFATLIWNRHISCSFSFHYWLQQNLQCRLKFSQYAALRIVNLKLFPVPVRLHSGSGKLNCLRYLRTLCKVWSLVRRRVTFFSWNAPRGCRSIYDRFMSTFM